MGRKKTKPVAEGGGFGECRPIQKKAEIELEEGTIISKLFDEVLPETPEGMLWFVRGQAAILRKTEESACSITILSDGSNQFKPILDLPEFSDIRKKLYIGDLKGYFEWCQSLS